jgi:hemerythrin
MSMMDWNDSYAIGIAIFDEEHKKLFSIIGMLHDAAVAGVVAEKIGTICDQLIEYTIMHFGHEEMYFNDCDYPEAERHVVMHQKLRDRTFAYRDRLLAGDVDAVSRELAEFLGNWLTHHIQIEDAKYARYMLDLHRHNTCTPSP